MNIEDVREHFGGMQKAADAIGCSYPSLYVWRRAGQIPERWQLVIEKRTRGKLKADTSYS